VAHEKMQRDLKIADPSNSAFQLLRVAPYDKYHSKSVESLEFDD
jgi:hypothetical protein